MSKTVLVTGSEGYIGSHIAKLLIDRKYQVIGCDIQQPRYGLQYHTFLPYDYRMLTGDELYRLPKIDAIVHTAARANVAGSVKDPDPFYEENVGGMMLLLRHMRIMDIPLMLFSSSSSVYSEVSANEKIAEHFPLNPSSPYGWSKLMCERIAQDFQKAYGTRVVSFRYFSVAGAHPSGKFGEWRTNEDHLIPLAISAALTSDAGMTIYGDGQKRRDFVSVNDISRAHLYALERWYAGALPDTLAYNLGSGVSHTIEEVVKWVQHIAGSFEIQYTSDKLGEAQNMCASTWLAERELGWTTRDDLGDMIATASRWFSSLLQKVREGNS